VRCSINVIARASCMETRLDHRRSACSNFINKVRSRPDQETTIGELAQKIQSFPAVAPTFDWFAYEA
ncbi:hypothetical protein, partial [Aeromonas caviae]|uniref:hypothetical protein n=1 Tax=Aeromonas caviae TaxID=648 RepID=UPI001FC7C4E9